jgi:hypothetical protein
MIFVHQAARTYKSYLTYFVPPILSSVQHAKCGITNIAAFLGWKLHQDFGMKELIDRFHNAVRLGKSPPIPYAEIILTAKIMDAIFHQINIQRGETA